MSRVLAYLGLAVALLAVLFLGGLSSAAWEVHRERKAGKVPTRPAWERRDRRRRTGGLPAALRGYWKGLRTPKRIEPTPWEFCTICAASTYVEQPSGQTRCYGQDNFAVQSLRLHAAFEDTFTSEGAGRDRL